MYNKLKYDGTEFLLFFYETYFKNLSKQINRMYYVI